MVLNGAESDGERGAHFLPQCLRGNGLFGGVCQISLSVFGWLSAGPREVGQDVAAREFGPRSRRLGDWRWFSTVGAALLVLSVATGAMFFRIFSYAQSIAYEKDPVTPHACAVISSKLVDVFAWAGSACTGPCFLPQVRVRLEGRSREITVSRFRTMLYSLYEADWRWEQEEEAMAYTNLFREDDVVPCFEFAGSSDVKLERGLPSFVRVGTTILIIGLVAVFCTCCCVLLWVYFSRGVWTAFFDLDLSPDQSSVEDLDECE